MTRPNIILILTDHFRRDAIGPSTPNLVGLASEGTRFANAYCASPLCQPARCSIITGMFPSQHGVCGNQNAPVADCLRDDTFMHRLQRAGYATALVGKQHYIDTFGLGVDLTTNDAELRRYGFDHVFQVTDECEIMRNEDEYTKHLASQGKLKAFREAYASHAAAGGPFPFAADDSSDGFIGINGIRFVKECAGEHPFYLNLSFIGPHPPYWHPGELKHKPAEMHAPLGMPDSEGDRLRRAHYMDKCALIDGYLGKLIDTLKDRGMYEHTVLIFTSDHGDNLGDYGIWDKRFYYEHSCGVPLIMAGPGIPRRERGNAPRVSKALVTHVDLYPTVLALAGIATPLIEGAQALTRA